MGLDDGSGSRSALANGLHNLAGALGRRIAAAVVRPIEHAACHASDGQLSQKIRAKIHIVFNDLHPILTWTRRPRTERHTAVQCMHFQRSERELEWVPGACQ